MAGIVTGAVPGNVNPLTANQTAQQMAPPIFAVPPQNVFGFQGNQGSNTTMVYLLSSPSGPEAILLSPSGTYASPGHPSADPAASNVQANVRTHPNTHVAGSATAPAAEANNANPPGPPALQPVGPAPRPGAPPHPAPGPGQVGAEEDAMGDLFRILLGLGGHLWLLVRLCGFFYLFASGAPWSRTILLGLGTALVFLAQNRAFRPILDGLWTSVRQHFEELVQFDAPRARENGAPAPVAGGAAPHNTRPNRHDSAGSMMLRRAERAVALFVASLFPGVGERHVAAQEEAARRARQQAEEARRQAEEASSAGDGERAVANGADSTTIEASTISQGADVGSNRANTASNAAGAAVAHGSDQDRPPREEPIAAL